MKCNPSRFKPFNLVKLSDEPLRYRDEMKSVRLPVEFRKDRNSATEDMTVSYGDLLEPFLEDGNAYLLCFCGETSIARYLLEWASQSILIELAITVIHCSISLGLNKTFAPVLDRFAGNFVSILAPFNSIPGHIHDDYLFLSTQALIKWCKCAIR